MITEKTAPIGTLVVSSQENIDEGTDPQEGEVYIVDGWREVDPNVHERDQIVRVRLLGKLAIRSFYAWRLDLEVEVEDTLVPEPKVYPKCFVCSKELCPEVDAYYGNDAYWEETCFECRRKHERMITK